MTRGDQEYRGAETVPSSPPKAEPARTEHRSEAGPPGIPIYVWLLGLVVMLLVLAVGTLWSVYALRGQWMEAGPTPTPIIWTPTAVPAPTGNPTSTPTPVGEPLPTVSPGIALGRTVRVVDTGGQGLSLRAGPGVDYQRMDVALDGETFTVVDGPTTAGGSEWWKIRDPDNEERAWWAVANFLEPIE